MQRGERRITLETVDYFTVIFGPSKSFRTLSWIGDVVGESLGALVSGSGKLPGSPSDLEISDAAMGLAAKSIFRNLHHIDERGRDGWDLIIEILSETSVIGEKGQVRLNKEIIETQFYGKLGQLLRLIAFVLKENYKDFLGDVLDLVGEIGPVKPAAEGSLQNNSTESTESTPEVPSTGASGGL